MNEFEHLMLTLTQLYNYYRVLNHIFLIQDSENNGQIIDSFGIELSSKSFKNIHHLIRQKIGCLNAMKCQR